VSRELRRREKVTLLIPKPTPTAAADPSLCPEKKHITQLHVHSTARVKGELEGWINN